MNRFSPCNRGRNTNFSLGNEEKVIIVFLRGISKKYLNFIFSHYNTQTTGGLDGHQSLFMKLPGNASCRCIR